MTLVRTGFIPLPAGAKPGFDHADVSINTRRIYVAHTGADRVEVIDGENERFLHSPPDLPGVAGVLVNERHELLFTSDRAVARVSVFRCSDERPLTRVGVGAHPNGLAYDRRRRRLYAFNLGELLGESCTASVVDLGTDQRVTEFALPGRPRWALYDEERDRVYANIRDPAQIVVIDPQRPGIERTIDVPSAGPHGLWLDAGRLFCAADGGDLIVLDCTTGEILAALPLPGVPDVVMHDPERGRLYVAIGEPGLACSFDTAGLKPTETVETEPGAHTMVWDPSGRRLYVFCAASCGAAIHEERG